MDQASGGERPRPVRAWRAVLAFAVVAASSGCALDTYTFGGGDDVANDAGLGDGGVDDGGGTGDGGIDARSADACVGFPELTFPCNGVDDDCDGVADNGYDLENDGANCGACGIQCFQPGANGTCVASECVYQCRFGFVDTDGDISNGCEYPCLQTNDGVEICDLSDNDCDGDFDEDLVPSLDEDENNCGTCGNRCLALNAEAICDGGTCGFGACDPGYADNVPLIAGCEYQCPVVPATAELCNGLDDDCDNGAPSGGVDELPIAGLGGVCQDPGMAADGRLFTDIGDTGACENGVLQCNFGQPACVGYVRPRVEGPANPGSCNDTVDDDCDTRIDEGFDKLGDPAHCGSCLPCSTQNPTNAVFTIEGCSQGACIVAGCIPGHVDLNGNPGDGCEYMCTRSGPEVCDGVDNDCDGAIDVADAGLGAAPAICRATGECAGTVATCAAEPCGGAIGWLCDYGIEVETDVCGDLPLQEADCDGKDGDCDGRIDEGDPLVAGGSRPATRCDNADVVDGVCVRTGEHRCVAGNEDAAAVCVLTSPVVLPTDEVCDNQDDDCDGTVDENAPDNMVAVVNGATTFYVYRYEASRPDATGAGFGAAGHRSCSKAGVLPWRNVTHTQAVAACAASGKRLCNADEWQLSCGGASGFAYPYGDVYDADACNGRDVDLDCLAPDSDQVAVTGRGFQCPVAGATQCVSPTGAVDMSGNLREWTATAVGTTAFRVRGGSFDNIDEGLACDFSFIAFGPALAFPNLGFRCCADQPDAP